MKENFTQGEWKLNKTGPHHNNPELCNIEITYSDSGECICDTVYKEADANLIAAAPDMYRLLVDISKSIDHCGDEIDTDFMRSSIEKLLAKARGEDA